MVTLALVSRIPPAILLLNVLLMQLWLPKEVSGKKALPPPDLHKMDHDEEKKTCHA